MITVPSVGQLDWEEMRAFLRLVIGMGLLIIENMAEYWSLHDVYKLPFFALLMVEDRFFLILSFFHVADNGRQLPRDLAE